MTETESTDGTALMPIQIIGHYDGYAVRWYSTGFYAKLIEFQFYDQAAAVGLLLLDAGQCPATAHEDETKLVYILKRGTAPI